MSPISKDSKFVLGIDGWCRDVDCVPSPHFDKRPDAVAIDLLVIHNISLPAGRYGTTYVADLFCDRLDYNASPSFAELRGIRVSAHFLIRREGELIQFVSTLDRAWHAGASSFGGRERCNDFSIGIELEGTDEEPFTDAQYNVLSRLTAALQRRHPLTDVVGHQHIAPGRKTDPGPFFDWVRYRKLLDQCQSQDGSPGVPQVLTHGSLRFFALS